MFWVFDTKLNLGRLTAYWVECQLNPASQANSVRACVLSVPALHPKLSSGVLTLSLSFTFPFVRKCDSCEKLKIRNLYMFDRFLGFSEKESYSYYWFTKIGRSDTTKSRKIFEMKIRTEEGEIFHFYFCQFFLSIYRRSQGEIALNQTLIYSASTVFIQQLTSSSYREQLQVKNDLIWTKKSKYDL